MLFFWVISSSIALQLENICPVLIHIFDCLQSTLSLKRRPVLIPASAIADNNITIIDLIGQDKKGRTAALL